MCLMDEPLSNLDAKLRHEMRDRDPRAAAAARDDDGLRDARPDRGDDHGRSRRADARRHVEQNGTPEELYNRPATAFTARFIGTPPMNLIRSGERLSEFGRSISVSCHRTVVRRA